MGGAASKDFLEDGPKTTIGKELDELGGYDRPALAKNQSFAARLDWLGTQVGKTSDQMQAALSKDETAGRRELEKEAKRRQLMALRRGQGDIQMNLQYADFYLKQKQFERGPLNSSASILRNSPIAALAADAVEGSEPSSPQMEAARRTAEQVATLQRLYSTKNGPNGVVPGPKPAQEPSVIASPGDVNGGGAKAPAGGNSRWRQSVQHAKKTAFLAVGTYVAMNGKKRFDPGRIDNFGLYAEQQLGDGMHKFVEEGERLAGAREKLPDMKAELENLRSAMQQLSVEQQEVEANIVPEEGEEDSAAQPESPGLLPAEHSGSHESDMGDPAEAAAVAAAAEAAMRHPNQNQKVNGVSKPRWHFGGGAETYVAPISPTNFLKAKSSAARMREPPAVPPSLPTPAAAAAAPGSISAPLPTAGLPNVNSGGPTSARRANHHTVPSNLNGSPRVLSAGLRPNPRARASWSGALSGSEGASHTSVGPTDTLMAHMAGGPLRPSRPSAPGAVRMSLGSPPVGARPASPGRSLLAPRPPSGGGSSLQVSGARPGVGRPGEPPRILADAPSTPGEHRVGTMAMRIASRIALPIRVAKHQLRALRDAETVNVLRQQQLIQAIEENAAILTTSSGLLNMYCNRANGRWVEQQQWAMAPVHEATMPAVRRMAERYREVVLKDLKAGRLAVQIHVDDDVFVSSRMGAVAMWSVDPWQLLVLSHPARTEWTSHLVGLGMGVRMLLALATAVEALVGAEAVAKMQVVIACHEGQVEAVVRDLAARKLCRFSPDNVVISVQQRAPGHSYDRAKHGFVPMPDAPLRPAGSGYALLGLGWAGSDAFRLGGPDLTERRPMERSTLDMYAERGVNWLASWRIRDLIHYSPESCLNVDQLALSYALADSMDANMSMQVELVDTLQGISRYGSGIVLALKERMAPPPPPNITNATTPLLRRNKQLVAAAAAAAAEAAAAKQPVPPDSPPQTTSPLTPAKPAHQPLTIPAQRYPVSAPPSPAPALAGTSNPGSPRVSMESSGRGLTGSRLGAGIGSEGGPMAACDIKWSDVQTPALAGGLQNLVDATALMAGIQPRLPVSIKRYMYHVPSLKAILTGPSIFRPSVSVGEGGFLYVTFDASDITVQPHARCAALSYTQRTAQAEGPPNGVGGAGGAGSSSMHLPPVQSPGATGPGGSAAGSPIGVASAAPKVRASSAGAAGSTYSSSSGAIALATAQAAAATMQRGRLLINDSDLDTLLWVMADQDNNPAFRASVSATNTARSRVTSRAAGGISGATGSAGPNRSQQQQRVIVAAVTDDPACTLAVRVAMAIMKPGADCLHILTIAKDISTMAVAAAKAVVERFENMASATLGDVKSIVQVKRLSIVEDIADYADSVRATLLVTGSMSLAAMQGGTSVVGSVALSLARDCNRPILVVKPNARLAESAYEVGKKLCLRTALCAETTSRPMVRFVVDHVLDGNRGDKLVLVRGRAFDKDMQELTSCRRILDHLAEEATNNRRFDSSLVVRRMVPGSFDAEHQRVADADQCHIVGIQVPECRGPLPPAVTNLLRTSRAAVLVYRTTLGRAAPGPTEA